MSHDKFSFAQMTSNSSNGKTSMGKTAGGYLIVVGSVIVLYATFFIRDIAILNAILLSGAGVIAAGSALVGTKVLSPSKPIKDETEK